MLHYNFVALHYVHTNMDRIQSRSQIIKHAVYKPAFLTLAPPWGIPLIIPYCTGKLHKTTKCKQTIQTKVKEPQGTVQSNRNNVDNK